METALKNIAVWYLDFILIEMKSQKYNPKYAQTNVFFAQNIVNSKSFPYRSSTEKKLDLDCS